MSAYDTTPDNGSVEQLEQRDSTALTEYMSVLADVGRARDAPGLFTVVGQNGGTYLVDVDTGACECPDHEYRDVRCKHRRRVAFATGQRPIPEWVNEEAVDPDLGQHIDDVRLEADGGEPEHFCKDCPEDEPATHTVVVNAPGRGFAEDPTCAQHAEESRGHVYVRDVREGFGQ